MNAENWGGVEGCSGGWYRIELILFGLLVLRCLLDLSGGG